MSPGVVPVRSWISKTHPGRLCQSCISENSMRRKNSLQCRIFLSYSWIWIQKLAAFWGREVFHKASIRIYSLDCSRRPQLLQIEAVDPRITRWLFANIFHWIPAFRVPGRECMSFPLWFFPWAPASCVYFALLPSVSS
jgi:hypothetical protein